MRLVFVGEGWQGSNARSLHEALARRPGVEICEVAVDHYRIGGASLPVRLVNRLAGPVARAELRRAVTEACREFRPDAVVFYKGWEFDAGFVEAVKAFAPVVNCFPDASPQAHGRRLSEAAGRYDLVISTKARHPELWRSLYGYRNPCVFVPHGYDPHVHLRRTPPGAFEYDLVLVATGRAEYHDLMLGLARQPRSDRLRVAIAGAGWAGLASAFPDGWRVVGPKLGTSYVQWVRRGRMVVAPVQRRVRVGGVDQPGDEDSARTYELAAAHCFFIHQRTELVRGLYDERTETPMFDGAEELADQIWRYRDAEDVRRAMAAAAHARAVPAYSVDTRAGQVLSHLRRLREGAAPVEAR